MLTAPSSGARSGGHAKQPSFHANAAGSGSRSWPSPTASCSTSPARCRCSPPPTICCARAAAPPLRVSAWWPRRRLVTASAGLALRPEPIPDARQPVDTLIVAGGSRRRPALRDPRPDRLDAARAKAARRIASVCTGAFLLAAAGLLDGRRAVTHWARCAELARRFPAVRLEPDPIFIARRRHLDLGRRHRRDRPGAGAGRGGSRPRPRPGGGAPAGGLPQAAGRPGAVQRHAGAAAGRAL